MTIGTPEETARDGEPVNKARAAAPFTQAEQKLSAAGATRPIATAAGGGRRGGRRWIFIIGLLILLPIIGYAGYLGWQVYDFSSGIYSTPAPTPTAEDVTATDTAEPISTAAPGQSTYTPRPTRTALFTATPEPTTILPIGRINILVLGTDKRTELQQQSARSDTLIVVSIDPAQKTAGILSIPRDLRVKIPGFKEDKINAAYFYGELNQLPGLGPGLAVQTVSRYFNIPIKYYLAINFDGFQKVVDTLGGIKVYNPEPITDDKYPGPYNSTETVHFNAGCLALNGEDALKYARTRHADSDFGRALRQQQVILAVRKKALQLDMVPHFSELLGDFKNMLETSIPPDQQFALAQLTSQISRSDIYTAQIDAAMVTQAPDGSDDLILNWKKATPMLDWFFGRGAYATLKPGATLTATAEPTASATRASARRATATPTSIFDLLTTTPAPTDLPLTLTPEPCG